MRAETQALLLAGAAALTFDAGMLLLKARGDRLPPLGWRMGSAAARAYAADPLWLLGLFLQPAGYALYLWALSRGPVAVVQPVMSAGIVLFVAFAVGVLGERLRAGEWGAVAAVGLGLFLLGWSLGPEGEPVSTGAAGWAVAGYSGAVFAVAAGASAGRWRGRLPGVALGIWSGVLLGLASLYAKNLASALTRLGDGPGLAALVGDPYPYLTAAGNIAGFYVLLHALRRARAAVVFTVSSTLSNIVPILGAMVALGERLPHGAVPAGLRIVALALTILGAACLARFDPGARPPLTPAIDTPPPV